MSTDNANKGTQKAISDEELIKLGKEYLKTREAKTAAQKRYRERRRGKGLKNVSLWSKAPTEEMINSGIVKPIVVFTTEKGRSYLKLHEPVFIDEDKERNQLVLKWMK